jgi:hypothetical protein
MTGALKFWQHGLPHAEHESQENKKWYALCLKKKIKSHPEGLSAGRAAMLADDNLEHDPEHMPSLTACTKYKSEQGIASRRESTTYRVEGLRATIDATPYHPGLTAQTVFFQPDFTELTRFTSIPFSTKFFLDEFVHFVSRCSGKVTLLFDFTHDICRQRFKLGLVAAMGTHYDRYMWRNSIVPAMCSIASKEVTGSALPIVQALALRLQTDHNLRLRAVGKRAILDGNVGLAEAVAIEIGCPQHDCLQHAKKRVSQKGWMWVHGNKARLVQSAMEHSAWWPSHPLRHVYWEREFQKLHGEGVEQQGAEHRFIKYFSTHQVFLKTDQLYHARWFSSILETEPGHGTYGANALESFWSVLDALQPIDEIEQDVRQVFTKLEAHAKAWNREEKFRDILIGQWVINCLFPRF